MLNKQKGRWPRREPESVGHVIPCSAQFAQYLITMFLKELISQGWQALMRDRTRSALTMLGIGWGLVSVVLLLAYGQGLGGCVLHAFLEHGKQRHRPVARTDQHAGRRTTRRQEQ